MHSYNPSRRNIYSLKPNISILVKHFNIRFTSFKYRFRLSCQAFLRINDFFSRYPDIFAQKTSKIRIKIKYKSSYSYFFQVKDNYFRKEKLNKKCCVYCVLMMAIFFFAPFSLSIFFICTGITFNLYITIKPGDRDIILIFSCPLA